MIKSETQEVGLGYWCTENFLLILTYSKLKNTDPSQGLANYAYWPGHFVNKVLLGSQRHPFIHTLSTIVWGLQGQS